MKKKIILIFGANGLIGKQLFSSKELNLKYHLIGFDIKKKAKEKIIKMNTLNTKSLKKKIK